MISVLTTNTPEHITYMCRSRISFNARVSVTRLDDISPRGKFKSSWTIFEGLFIMLQNLEPTFEFFYAMEHISIVTNSIFKNYLVILVALVKAWTNQLVSKCTIPL